MKKKINLEKLIMSFLNKKNSNKIPLTKTTNFIVEGIIDSLIFIELIFFIEKKTKKKINLSKINIENFINIKTIMKTVKRL